LLRDIAQQENSNSFQYLVKHNVTFCVLWTSDGLVGKIFSTKCSIELYS